MAEQKSGSKQRGSSFWGFMGGLVVGVGVASAVALYITKVPTPFMNRNQPRSADQDVAEQRRNSTWDPNAALYGRNPAPRPAVSAPAPAAVPAPAPAPVAAPAPATRTQAANARTTVPVPSPDEGAPPEPAAAPRPAPRATANATATATANANAGANATGGSRATAANNDPLGELVSRTTGRTPAPQQVAAAPPAAVDGYNYVLQVGAYNSMADAEAQRARLSMQGIESRITEREVNGRPIYRVRVGPFDSREAADRAKDRLDASGSVATMLRVQR